MTFGAGWALAGLVLLVPLVILHLRPRTRTPRELPSLLLWRGLESDATTVSRRPRLPPLPLLLLLQALALIALVLAVAKPSSGNSPRPAATVIVLDDSFWLQAPGRLADERRQAQRIIAAAPAGGAIRIVEADGTPTVVYRGPAAGAGRILSGLRAGASAPDLPAAITVAAGLLTASNDRLAVVRTPEAALPPLRAGATELRTVVAGATIADQGIFDPSARCGVGSPTTCEIVATVTNGGASPVVEHIVADVPGHPPLALSARVGARSSAPIELLAAPGEHVELQLRGTDPLPVDDRAWVAVPEEGGLARPATVTVVGQRATALPVAQALAACRCDPAGPDAGEVSRSAGPLQRPRRRRRCVARRRPATGTGGAADRSAPAPGGSRRWCSGGSDAERHRPDEPVARRRRPQRPGRRVGRRRTGWYCRDR